MVLGLMLFSSAISHALAFRVIWTRRRSGIVRAWGSVGVGHVT